MEKKFQLEFSSEPSFPRVGELETADERVRRQTDKIVDQFAQTHILHIMRGGFRLSCLTGLIWSPILSAFRQQAQDKKAPALMISRSIDYAARSDRIGNQQRRLNKAAS